MYFFKKGLRKLIIFGVNQLVCDLIGICRRLGVDIVIISGPRSRAVEFIENADYSNCEFCVDWIEIQDDVEYIELTKLTADDVAGHLIDDCAGFSFGSPFIIQRSVIDLFQGIIFNEHGARLPRGKGGGGYSWRIMDHDREGSVLFHLLTEDIDGGDIIYREDFMFPSSCKKPIDYSKYQYRLSVDALETFINGLYSNSMFQPQPQPERFSSYLPRLHDASQAFVDWTWNVTEVLSFIHAFSAPYEGAKTFFNGRKIYLLDAYVHHIREHSHPFKRGIVWKIFDGNLYVAALEGTLVVTEYVLEKGSNDVVVGDRFHTPADALEASLSKRVVYTPLGIKI